MAIGEPSQAQPALSSESQNHVFHPYNSSEASPIEAASFDDLRNDPLVPSDVDAGTRDDLRSITTSALLRNVFVNGRRFHLPSDGPDQLMPNDVQEQELEQFKHHATLEFTDHKLFLAPVSKSSMRVVDLGTGTGAWAIDVAYQYPDAEVIGIDDSPIQHEMVTPNVQFIVGRIEDELPRQSNFDLVHIRSVCPYVPNPVELLSLSYTALNDGGWIEVQEYGMTLKCDDNTLRPDSALSVITDKTNEVLRSIRRQGFGFRGTIGYELGDILSRLGFINIRCKPIRLPIGAWARKKKLRLWGKYFEHIAHGTMGSLQAKILPRVMAEDEARGLVAQAMEDMEVADQHIYCEFLVWWAQKPGGPTTNGA